MDPDPYSIAHQETASYLAQIADSPPVLTMLLLFLIICSALVSGSEVAFFSLTPAQVKDLADSKNSTTHRILSLRNNPKKLLATILIANNFINIAIVLVSQMLLTTIFGKDNFLRMADWLSEYILGSKIDTNLTADIISFLITVVLVTAVLVLLGEIVPKVYANTNNVSFATLMSLPLSVLQVLLTPFSDLLIKMTAGLERRITQSKLYLTGGTKDDLDTAIELAVTDSEDSDKEVGLLKGILKFSDVTTKQVMKPRVDIIAVDITTNFAELMKIVKSSGYSRIPVYEEDLDHIVGILYVKDLLGYTDENLDFNWQELVRRQIYYVPEHKKIDDLLRDFQLKRMHMAIVVNEYGGTIGIVTLEDIMEEVIGEIKDEFDDENDVAYIKLDEYNYIFEGKTLLNDVCRIIGEPVGYFDDLKGNSDSLAGLMIELLGHLPKAENEIKIKNYFLKAITVTNRRIEKINLRKEHKIA